MKVTVLGTADGHTSVSRQHAGLLLQDGSTSLLLDSGANVAQHLFRAKLDPNLPSAFWLSHLHSDHVGQFAMLIQSLWLRQRCDPLQIFCPALAVPTLQRWLEQCLLFPPLLGFALEWHPIEAQRAVTLGSWQLEAFATRHLAGLSDQFQKAYPQTSFDCFGVAIRHKAGRFVYSADLASPDDLEPILRGQKTTFLVCEVSHFSSAELFRFLASVSVNKVALTHYSDETAGRSQELISDATAQGFSGEVIVLQEGWEGEV